MTAERLAALRECEIAHFATLYSAPTRHTALPEVLAMQGRAPQDVACRVYDMLPKHYAFRIALLDRQPGNRDGR